MCVHCSATHAMRKPCSLNAAEAKITVFETQVRHICCPKRDAAVARGENACAPAKMNCLERTKDALNLGVDSKAPHPKRNAQVSKLRGSRQPGRDNAFDALVR